MTYVREIGLEVIWVSLPFLVANAQDIPWDFTCLIWGQPALRAISEDVSGFNSGHHFAVGDNGWIFYLENGKIKDRGNYPWSDYNFTGVSFTNTKTGFIVGYKKNEPDKWKGVVLKTTGDGEDPRFWNWTPVLYSTDIPEMVLPTAFLDVKAVDNVVWVSCANGQVLRSPDGGNTWYVYTPAKLAPANTDIGFSSTTYSYPSD